MPFLYIYSPSDFVTPPPAESGSAAAGSAPFTLQLNPGATGTVVEITDNDTVFNEIDFSQVVTSTVNIDGTVIPAGTSIHAAYDLINSGTGHIVTSLHFGGNGYQQGAVDGIVSSVPLVPGVTYVFNIERTSYGQFTPYDTYVACYCSGTKIATASGPRRIETLRPGDLVRTADHGMQPIRWCGAREVEGRGAFAPVRLHKGFLGLRQDLWVSPQHRMLVRSGEVSLSTGADQALAAAIHLCAPGQAEQVEQPSVTYHHLLFDHHEVIYANGAASESLLVSAQSLAGFCADSQAELHALFPEICARTKPMLAARPILRGYEARLLASWAKAA